MPEDYQGELFKEFEKKESSLKRLSRKILPKRKPHILQIPLENIVTFAILIILGFIVAFALGVEKGKREVKLIHKEKEVIAVEIEEVAPKEIKPPIVVTEVKKPYTIQLISFKEKKIALAKVKELKAKGMEADFVEENNWFKVYVGSYKDKKDAESDLRELSKDYKGCFLRSK